VSALNADRQNSVGKSERERQSSDFNNLSDEFGHKLFPSPQIIGKHGDATAANPDDVDGAHRRQRVELAGQRKGSLDTNAIASVQPAADAKTPADLAGRLDQINKVAQTGEQRTDRFSNVLQKRDGDHLQEQSIKCQIEGINEQKQASLVQKFEKERTDTLSDKQGDKHTDKHKHKDKDSERDPLAKMIFAFHEELRQNGDRVSKDFADWADSRVLAGMLGNKRTAENGMGDLVEKARQGSTSARDFLAGTLVSGSAQDSWLTAKRADFDGSRRPVAIPNLAPEMNLELKNQAAKGLISLADSQAGLSRSDQMALAIGMGQAFENRLAGNMTAANNELLTTTMLHFEKMLAIDPQSAKSRQESDRQSKMRQNAMNGLDDAVKAQVPGANRVAEFFDQALAGQSAKAKTHSAEQAAISDALKNLTDATMQAGETDAIAKQQTDGQVKRQADKTMFSDVINFGTGALHALLNNPDALNKLWSGRTKSGKRTESEGDPEHESGIKSTVRGARSSTGWLRGAKTQSSEDGHTAVRRATRAKFKVGERKEFVRLDSGRVYDPVLSRFFVRSGDTLVEDTKPGTDLERSQIADLNKKQQSAPVEIVKSHNATTNPGLCSK